MPGEPAADVGVSGLGVEPDGLGVVGDGVVELVFLPPRGGASQERLGILGIESDGLGGAGNGLVEGLLIGEIRAMNVWRAGLPAGHVASDETMVRAQSSARARSLRRIIHRRRNVCHHRRQGEHQKHRGRPDAGPGQPAG